MKKHKFLRALISVIFSIFLFVAAILPCFAIEFYVGGGAGYGSPMFLRRIPISYIVHYPDFAYLDPTYFSFSFDPLFNLSSLPDFSTYIQGNDEHALYPDDQSSFLSASFSYTYSDYSGNFNFGDGGNLSCSFQLNTFAAYTSSSVSFPQFMTSDYLAFGCDSFYAWSQPFNGHNSEFSITLDLSRSSIDPLLFDSSDYISFSFLPLGSFYSHSEYVDVRLPISEFVDFDNDLLTISLDSYFDDLNPGSVFYLVRNFRAFFSSNGSSDLYGEVSYCFNPAVDDIFTLYPSPAEQMELHDYTDWLSHALEGFLMLQIFPGFYLSGFLLVILGFAMFIWALKVFAGG